jgi:hypothetical protein
LLVASIGRNIRFGWWFLALVKPRIKIVPTVDAAPYCGSGLWRGRSQTRPNFDFDRSRRVHVASGSCTGRAVASIEQAAGQLPHDAERAAGQTTAL